MYVSRRTAERMIVVGDLVDAVLDIGWKVSLIAMCWHAILYY